MNYSAHVYHVATLTPKFHPIMGVAGTLDADSCVILWRSVYDGQMVDENMKDRCVVCWA